MRHWPWDNESFHRGESVGATEVGQSDDSRADITNSGVDKETNKTDTSLNNQVDDSADDERVGKDNEKDDSSNNQDSEKSDKKDEDEIINDNTEGNINKENDSIEDNSNSDNNGKDGNTDQIGPRSGDKNDIDENERSGTNSSKDESSPTSEEISVKNKTYSGVDNDSSHDDNESGSKQPNEQRSSNESTINRRDDLLDNTCEQMDTSSPSLDRGPELNHSKTVKSGDTLLDEPCEKVEAKKVNENSNNQSEKEQTSGNLDNFVDTETFGVNSDNEIELCKEINTCNEQTQTDIDLLVMKDKFCEENSKEIKRNLLDATVQTQLEQPSKSKVSCDFDSEKLSELEGKLRLKTMMLTEADKRLANLHKNIQRLLKLIVPTADITDDGKGIETLVEDMIRQHETSPQTLQAASQNDCKGKGEVTKQSLKETSANPDKQIEHSESQIDTANKDSLTKDNPIENNVQRQDLETVNNVHSLQPDSMSNDKEVSGNGNNQDLQKEDSETQNNLTKDDSQSGQNNQKSSITNQDGHDENSESQSNMTKEDSQMKDNQIDNDLQRQELENVDDPQS